MICSVNTFKWKLQLLTRKLQRKDLHFFQHMHSELECQGKDTAQFDSARYVEQVQSVLSEFDISFLEFASLEPIAT